MRPNPKLTDPEAVVVAAASVLVAVVAVVDATIIAAIHGSRANRAGNISDAQNPGAVTQTRPAGYK
jgi:hypothetical protein